MSRTEHFEAGAGDGRHVPVANSVPDTVERRISGGVGHLPGDETRSVVAMVPVSTMRRFREHNGIQNPHIAGHDQRIIDGIRADIRSGLGITNPIMLDYDHDMKWASIGEGNHRLAAAEQEGLTHVPVTVYGRGHLARRKDKGLGAPLQMTTKFRDDGWNYVPPNVHPHHFDALRG